MRLRRLGALIACGWAVAAGARAEEKAFVAATTDLSAALSFEEGTPGQWPQGWRGGPQAMGRLTMETVHSGTMAAVLEPSAASVGSSTVLTRSLPIAFEGHRVELRGFLRTENVTGFAGLWLREDSAAGSVGLDNMQSQNLHGTHDWAEFSISLPLDVRARTLVFGVLLVGPGKVWADDLQLLVDGRPPWSLPKVEHTPSVLETDHEFDRGSKVQLASPLSPIQVANLALLGRVWGFLKYHHPQVIAGRMHWDYELFRVMPSVLAAADADEGTAALTRWIDRLGEVAPAKASASPPADNFLRPDNAWIDDPSLGPELARRLKAVLASLPTGATQFYVAQARGVGNPEFENELPYANVTLPDPGFQLLGLFRFWSIVHTWAPYRNLPDQDWNTVLASFIPRIASAPNATEYKREMLQLIALVQDTHANLWGSLGVRPPTGEGRIPALFRFVDGQPVVSGLIPTEKSPGKVSTSLQRGDVVLALDQHPVAELLETWRPFYAASNESTRLRDIGRALGQGPVGPMTVTVRRGPDVVEVKTERVLDTALPKNPPGATTHDLPGPTFRLLSHDVAYLKLSSVKASEVDDYVRQAAGTQGWIIDIRNYPAEFVVFALGQHLVEKPTEFARFTVGQLDHPGAFAFGPAMRLNPHAPFYSGKVVLLVDEISLSQAEYTTMAFRVAPRALVIGSTTAGADGNVSRIPLPGGLNTMISGIGVYYPDKRPTQRLGIIPDIEVKPTVKGLGEGRDEVLEEALRQILGSETRPAELRALIPSAP